MKIYQLPEEIEAESFAIIERELGGRTFPADEWPVIRRVIHATADFDYAENLIFSRGVIAHACETLRQGAVIVCDTEMVRAGVNKKSLGELRGEAVCWIGDDSVTIRAAEAGTTRAVAAVEKAAALSDKRPVLFAVGNAPTALARIVELTKQGNLSPALVIGVPVGFVNVVESKELLIASEIPHIASKGRKGGSSIAAAICNALIQETIREARRR